MRYGTPEKTAADALFIRLTKELLSGSRDLEAVSLTGPEVSRHYDQFIKNIGVRSLHIAESNPAIHKKISGHVHHSRAVRLLPVGDVAQFLLSKIRQDRKLNIIDLDACGLGTIFGSISLVPKVITRPGIVRLVFSMRGESFRSDCFRDQQGLECGA